MKIPILLLAFLTLTTNGVVAMIPVSKNYNPYLQYNVPQPPALPNTYGQQPPALPNTYGQQLPAYPNTYGQQPPAYPNTYGQQPSAYQNTYGQQLPAYPNTYGQQPPALPNTYGQQPPALPNTYGQHPSAYQNTYAQQLPALPNVRTLPHISKKVFDLERANTIWNPNYDTSLPIKEDAAFFEGIPDTNEPKDSKDCLTQANVRENIEKLIEKFSEMRIGSGYEIPNKACDIEEHKKLQLASKKRKIIHEISVQVSGHDGYTAMGANKKDLFYRIMDILRDPNDLLYKKTRKYITSEISNRCEEWIKDKMWRKLNDDDKKFILWFVDSLNSTNSINFEDSSVVKIFFDSLLEAAIDKKRVEAIKNQKNISNRIEENLNAITNPKIYYECVKHFIKYILTNKTSGDSKCYFSIRNGLGNVIAYIINQRIPVILYDDKSPDNKKIINIFGHDIKTNLIPRIWLIALNGEFRRGQILLSDLDSNSSSDSASDSSSSSDSESDSSSSSDSESDSSFSSDSESDFSSDSDSESDFSSDSDSESGSDLKFDLESARPILDDNFDTSLPIKEQDESFLQGVKGTKELHDETEMLTQENIKNDIEELIKNHQMYDTSGMAISSLEDVKEGGNLERGAPTSRNTIYNVHVQGSGHCGYTAMGVNKKSLFYRIMNILRNPNDLLYEKTRKYITAEIANRCHDWLTDTYLFGKLKPEDKIFILWFVNMLGKTYDLNGRDAVKDLYSSLSVNDVEIENIRKSGGNNIKISENLNAIKNPTIYYECVKHFLKRMLVSNNSGDTLYYLTTDEGMGDIIAYIINQRIPVVQGNSILKIFGKDIKTNLIPRVWLIYNNEHFERGQIFL